MSVHEQDLTDEFQAFLVSLHNIVDGLIEEAHLSGYELDFSMESLDALENYILTACDGLGEDAKERLVGRAARYFGEVVRRRYGGQWACVSDPQDPEYGLPVIEGHTTYDIHLAPSEMIRNFLVRRQAGLLQRIVLNDVEPKNLDLSDLIE